MTYPSRSLDDLPLAAHSTGTEPDPRLEALEATEPDPTVAPGASAARGPVLRTDDSPSAQARSRPAGVLRRLGSFGRLGSLGSLGRLARPIPPMPRWLAHPRQNLRDPRLLFTGVIVVGVVLLVLSLLMGSGPTGPGAADASPGAPAAAPSSAPAGNASVDVTGKLEASYALTGITGSGPAAEGRLEATWGDASGATLGLSGPAYGGTRTTDAGLVLTWTVLVGGAPVTFTSDAAECTIGMAVNFKNVSGTFVCKKLESDDGELVVDVRGSYRT